MFFIVLQSVVHSDNYFKHSVFTVAMDSAAVEGTPFELLNEDLLLEILDQSDIEYLNDDDDDVDPQPQLVSDCIDQTEEDRCPSPPNSDVPLSVRLEELKKRHQWRIKSWQTPDLIEEIEQVRDLLNPGEYFDKYIPDELYEVAAVETNKYSLMTKGVQLNTTPAEIRKFFGMLLIMGTIRYPRLRMYWDTKYRLPAIAEAMTRNRFTSLRVCLHFVDNNIVSDEERRRNKLWKVQPLIESVRNHCLELPRFASDYSIDEQMIPFLGACPVRAFVKNKPRPVGLKNFVCTTSEGMVMDFEIYQGKSTPWEESSLGLGANVILHLVKTLPAGSRIFYDRYFSTLPLLDALRAKGMFGTGTIMSNRLGGVIFKSDREMQRGESVQKVRGDENVCLVKWKDNKTVVLASNIYGKEPNHDVQRWDKKEKKYSNVTCPNIVKKYNEKMGGVDICDQQMEAYRTFFKTKKWTLKVAIHFIDLAAVNSWMEYRKDAISSVIPKKDILDLMKLRLAVGEKLIASPTATRFNEEEDILEPPAKKSLCAALPCVEKKLDGFEHWPVMDELSTARNCRVQGCRSRTRVRCTKCNIYLCLSTKNNCFMEFHQ